VVVEFLVDIEGRVRNPFVVRSLNPSFDDSAIDAVRKWRFEPGRIGKRPVVTRMQVPMSFQLNDKEKGGGDGLLRTTKGDFATLPEELRYDTPPRLIGSFRPVYPYALLSSRAKGRALIRFFVDERGRVMHAIVGEASSPEFGQALLAAVEHFAYEPATKGGKPSKALMGFSQEFTTDDAFQLVSDRDLDLLQREQKRPESIVGPGEIDGKLQPVSQRPPRFPFSLAEKTNRGEALVELIVDEEGRVRLPRVVSATEAEFGYAAVQALSAWRFEPPTRGGRATAVRVKVPIRFNNQPEPPPAAKN
jgi:TonB family protein